MNYLKNTQYQIFTALGTMSKQIEDGSASVPPTAVSSYTTSSNTVVCLASDTSDLVVGDLVQFSTAAHTNMKICPLEVLSIVNNVSFTVKLPINLGAATSAACTAQPVTRGSSAGTSGNAADMFSKSTSLTLWRELNPNNLSIRAEAALGCRKTSSGTEVLKQYLDSLSILELRGRTLTMSVVVKGGTASISILTDQTGTTIGNQDCSAGFTQLTVEHTIPDDATSIAAQVNLTGSIGDVSYISEMSLQLGSGNTIYDRRPNEYIIPVVKTTPLSWNGATMTMPIAANAAGDWGFDVNVWQETAGAIAKSVKLINLQLESRCDTVDRAIGLRQQETTPHIYSILNYHPVSGKMATGEGLCTPKVGHFYCYSNASGANFYNTSIDINGFVIS